MRSGNLETWDSENFRIPDLNIREFGKVGIFEQRYFEIEEFLLGNFET